MTPTTEVAPLEAARLLRAEEVARILNVRPKRVYELGIPAVRISDRAVRWRPSQVQQWIEEREGV